MRLATCFKRCANGAAISSVFIVALAPLKAAAQVVPARADSIPSFLVGEWMTQAMAKRTAADTARYVAVYLDHDGSAVAVAGPPPIGSPGTAIYSPRDHRVTITFPPDGQRSPRTCTLDYAVAANLLVLEPCGGTKGDTLVRTRDSIPTFIREEIRRAGKRGSDAIDSLTADLASTTVAARGNAVAALARMPLSAIPSATRDALIALLEREATGQEPVDPHPHASKTDPREQTV